MRRCWANLLQPPVEQDSLVPVQYTGLQIFSRGVMEVHLYQGLLKSSFVSLNCWGISAYKIKTINKNQYMLFVVEIST